MTQDQTKPVPPENLNRAYQLLVFPTLWRKTPVHVTRNPTARWIAQQITEAFPWDMAPRYLLRDRDCTYGSEFRDRLRTMEVEEVVSALRSLWQNPYVERLIGSIRRECLEHVPEECLRRALLPKSNAFLFRRTLDTGRTLVSLISPELFRSPDRVFRNDRFSGRTGIAESLVQRPTRWKTVGRESTMTGTLGSDIRETLRQVLESEAEVELAYLFGSAAGKHAAEAKDVDVAVGLTAPLDPLARLHALGRIEDRLRAALERSIDVVDLYRAPPLLLHEILRVGRPPVLVRDEKRWLLFENAARKRYFDMKRRYAVYDREGFR